MKFCSECGTKLTEEAAFCSECGTPFGQVKSTTPPPSPPRQPWSKKKKIALASGIAAVVILFGVHNLIDSLLSKERLIEKFETALHDQNAQKVASLLSSDDKKMEINEKTVAGLMNYFDENPDEINTVTRELNNQAELLDEADEKDESTALDLFEEFTWGSLVTLQQEGKFLFYDQYQLHINSVYLTLETNYKDTVLYVDDEEVGTADSPNFEATYGPFLPGNHTIKGVLTTDYLDLNSEKEIHLTGRKDKVTEYLNIDAEELTVRLPDRNNTEGSAALFINGKDVGINLYENPTFGPVLTDGSMSFHVESTLPWGKVKTEEKAIDNNRIEVSYITEDLKTTLMKTVDTYLQEWGTAYTTLDISKMTAATEELKEITLAQANADKEEEMALISEYLGVNIDWNSFNLSSGDNWTATLKVQELWNADFYFPDEEIELADASSISSYSLTYKSDENKWVVARINPAYGIDEDSMKELKLDEPKEYASTWGTATVSAATEAEEQETDEAEENEDTTEAETEKTVETTEA